MIITFSRFFRFLVMWTVREGQYKIYNIAADTILNLRKVSGAKMLISCLKHGNLFHFYAVPSGIFDKHCKFLILYKIIQTNLTSQDYLFKVTQIIWAGRTLWTIKGKMSRDFSTLLHLVKQFCLGPLWTGYNRVANFKFSLKLSVLSLTIQIWMIQWNSLNIF